MSETNAAAPREDEQEQQQPPPPEQKPDTSETAKRTMALALSPTGAVVVTKFQEQWDFASAAFKQGVLGPGIKTTGQAWVLMQRGAELGFPLLTACEYLYIVKGRIRMTPDGAKAKALASGLLGDFRESFAGEHGTDQFRAVCVVVRRGLRTPVEREFSVEDARTAKLWGKSDSAWQTYPKRMLAARARGYAFADAFRDVCGGLQIRERFDLDPGEAIGGDLPLPPEVQRLASGRAPVDPQAKPARVTFSAPIVADTVDAEMVETKAELGANIETRPLKSEQELLDKIDAAKDEPTAFDLASAEASLRAECSKRASGDVAAAGDLFKEVTSQGLANEQDYDNAMAAIRQHPHFGDDDGPSVLTSPKADQKKGGRK